MVAIIAVIQNGTEVSRSSWADVAADYFQEAVRLISGDVVDAGVEFFADDEVNRLLATLDNDVACIIFATNSLTSDRVNRAVADHLEKLHAYIDRGGGVIVLHQWLDSLSSVLPHDLCPAMATRTSPAPDPTPVYPPQVNDMDDIVLHYPIEVAFDGLRDGGFEFGPSWLFFKALVRPTLPDLFKLVLVRNDTEALLVRTNDHVPQRVVVCTPLLDWQGNTAMLANLIRWAAFGSPIRLLRVGENPAPRKLLHWWLGLDRSSAVSSAPAQSGELSRAERWLLTNPQSEVELFVIPPENLALLKDRPEVLCFLERGGTMLTTDVATELPATKITAYVGRYTKRELARGLYARMRSVGGWDTVDSAHRLRNIAAVLTLLWVDEFNRTPGAVSPGEISGVVDEILERLAIPRHQEDLSSSIALAQVVALLDSSERSNLNLIDAMLERRLAQQFDVRLQILAVRIGWSRNADQDYLQDVRAALVDAVPALSRVAPVVRVLDSIALLHQLGLLHADRGCVKGLAELIADQLERFPPQPEVGWASVEATADVVRGVLAILDLLGQDYPEVAERLAEHAVAGAQVVLRELGRGKSTPDARDVGRRARLTHALLLAVDYFPVGVQRLTTLQWPDSSAVTAGAPSTQGALIDHLVAENKRLRDLEQQLSQARLAAIVGRGGVTWLPALLIVVLGIAVAVEVGSDSVLSLLGNVSLLVGTLLTLLGFLFDELNKKHLLAASGQSLLNLLKKAVELLGSLGKLKGR
ncbi:hypothetical protein DXK94_07860 [Arthrobacter sp. RT-1]|uniref:hypothetical protein n=1 Tax=Arthrobacter sp. RT-1 TaxID=2292263 RepID=UPI000E1EB249|nr:hypothetical protein [Arthrobacter sp. RT-1]RDV10449.1 hypothetical protein DXK94_07860 [Arthrobacter sp. RT-1]